MDTALCAILYTDKLFSLLHKVRSFVSDDESVSKLFSFFPSKVIVHVFQSSSVYKYLTHASLAVLLKLSLILMCIFSRYKVTVARLNNNI
jgi:hypothetical protein